MKQFSWVLALVFCLYMPAFAQISQGGKPYSITHDVSDENVFVYTLPLQDNAALEDDANIRSKKGEGPWLFAAPVEVNLSPYNSGT